MTSKSATPTAAPPSEAADTAKLTEKMSDTEIMAAIQGQLAEQRKAAKAAGPRRVSVQEVFDQSIALVAAATGKNFRQVPRVSEQTAVKVLELTMMWALNNRDTTTGQILDTEGEGAADEGPVGPEVINEIIGSDTAETE